MDNAVPFEPYRIKAVEAIRLSSRAEREGWLREADYNLFRLPAEQVMIDLLTDSGTGAMSAEQWAGMMVGDESYAGARSFFRLQETVQQITGMPYMVPVHQGRAAEHLLFGLLLREGDHVPSNQHFDTTEANIETRGAHADSLVIAAARDPQSLHPFKGNIDIARLREYISKYGKERIPIACITLTNNSGGGQPVSLENIRAVAGLLKEAGIPFFLDCARYAENAWFIQQREAGQEQRSVREIAREVFDMADGCWMSSKKDGLVNIGGFIALRDEALYEQICQRMVIYEGFPTYGGMAGYSMEALARGLGEGLDEGYLRWRVGQVARLGEQMKARGVPILEPVGGHAVYIDARRFLRDMPQAHFPAQVISCAMYRLGGVRTVEIGSVMFAKDDPVAGETSYPDLELLRLTIPRRLYTNSHLDYVAEVAAQTLAERDQLVGLRITHAPPALRHFTARFAPITD